MESLTSLSSAAPMAAAVPAIFNEALRPPSNVEYPTSVDQVACNRFFGELILLISDKPVLLGGHGFDLVTRGTLVAMNLCPSIPDWVSIH